MKSSISSSPNQTSRKLKRQIKGSFQPRIPKQRKEKQEFGPGKTALVCQVCGAVYADKSWHHAQQTSFAKKFVICPACQMIKDKKYEGQVILKDLPLDKKSEILNLVKHVGQRAYQRDPLDRIIKIEDKGSQIEILTTENQLAVSLGKQIKRAFKGHLKINWSHQESTTRVIWAYGK